MKSTSPCLNVISAVNEYHSARAEGILDEPATELFGCNVFHKRRMQERLPKSICDSIQETIAIGSQLDISVADVIASALKDWAIERGATHFAHVFYPLTGSTAEKHDSFLVPDGKGGCIAEFKGSCLVQGEPDASSFPNGGIRDTFEARGYTAWDVTSPAYILENDNGSTLCIPTIFVSWTGEALDKKTPVLRSVQALDLAARRLLDLFGHTEISRVDSFIGPEQEYFLVDSNFFYSRMDLLTTGRTVFGAPALRGQEFDDHYFGVIPDRVLAFMMEVEQELYKIGVPVKTRHNEVAPGQYEIAPLFESANIATDHIQLIMFILKKVAKKQGMSVLFHEKPFAGLNGSGKHVNWSFGNRTQGNLLDPGPLPHENKQFLLCCAAVIRAIDIHAGLLRATVASAGNDHRLGANEAPPAIMSIYLGDQLHDIFEQFRMSGSATRSKEADALEVGVETLPELLKDTSDRNRTSPFAFTGNRFEFRAVGANQSVAGPVMVLNTILADSLHYVVDELQRRQERGVSFDESIEEVIHTIMQEHGRVIFHGNGYSEEWQKEATDVRRLKNFKSTPEALAEFTSPDTIKVFEKIKVLSKEELISRRAIYEEQYVLSINVEANVAEKLAITSILPAALRYQTELAKNIQKLEAAGIESDSTLLKKLTQLIAELNQKITALQKARSKHLETLSEETVYYSEVVIPSINSLRKTVDALEALVADDLWPLPSYTEMLFIK